MKLLRAELYPVKNLYIEILTPVSQKINAFGDRTIKEVIKLNWTVRVDLNSTWFAS
jgi:hypothetical protein